MYIWCFNFNKHGRRSPPGLLGGWSPSLALEPCPGRAAPPAPLTKNMESVKVL